MANAPVILSRTARLTCPWRHFTATGTAADLTPVQRARRDASGLGKFDHRHLGKRTRRGQLTSVKYPHLALRKGPCRRRSSLHERASGGSSRSTLTVALAAIKAGHRAARQCFDGADPKLQRALFAGARREVVRDVRQHGGERPRPS